jgi:predicted dinucleotide-binding enzyme
MVPSIITEHSSHPPLIKSKSRSFGSIKATGFYCGDDIAAKAVVSSLIKETGLDPVDAGPLSCARYLEPMAMLMMQLRFSQKMGAEIALGLLQR